jgi:molybdate transport system substrate-binding protein
VIQLAVANPVHAPYGRAGVTLLEHYGFITRTRDVDWEDKRQGIPAYFDLTPLREGKRSFEFVYGENISQAAQLAATAANVGLIAYSLALAEDFQRLGKFWLAPLESHLRLDQEYIVITGQARPEVMAFYEFVGSPQGREILERYGFILPDAPESNGE